MLCSYINLFTKIQLTDVSTVENLNGNTPFNISGNSLIDINNSTCCIIDPRGDLFGNTPCGLNNYLHYVIPNNWCNGADTDKNGIVDVIDLGMIGTYWQNQSCNSSNGFCNNSDGNKDGKVDVIDLGFVGTFWQKECNG